MVKIIYSTLKLPLTNNVVESLKSLINGPLSLDSLHQTVYCSQRLRMNIHAHIIEIILHPKSPK